MGTTLILGVLFVQDVNIHAHLYVHVLYYKH